MTAVALVAVVVALVAVGVAVAARRARRSEVAALTGQLEVARQAARPDPVVRSADPPTEVPTVREPAAEAEQAAGGTVADGPEVIGADGAEVVAGDGEEAFAAGGAEVVAADGAEGGAAGNAAAVDAGGAEVVGGGADGVLGALWALTALEQVRTRRSAEALSTAAPSSGPSDGLAAGLEDEVGRLREETGTPGTLRVALDAEPAPGDAELLLRSVQSLLAVLSRHCQGYDLYVHRWERRLVAVLVCDGFDGPDSVAEETADVLGALAPVGGRIELDRDPQERLRARLSIPAH